MVNGPAWKALIEEEFGDGIMSAIDFDMQMERLPNPKGESGQDHHVGQVSCRTNITAIPATRPSMATKRSSYPRHVSDIHLNPNEIARSPKVQYGLSPIADVIVHSGPFLRPKCSNLLVENLSSSDAHCRQGKLHSTIWRDCRRRMHSRPDSARRWVERTITSAIGLRP